MWRLHYQGGSPVNAPRRPVYVILYWLFLALLVQFLTPAATADTGAPRPEGATGCSATATILRPTMLWMRLDYGYARWRI
jgi:hypothetical protein